MLLYNPDGQVFFDGRVQKLCSVLAAYCSVRFNTQLRQCDALKHKTTSDPIFDCRVFTTPDLMEAANVFVWREQDARRNAILTLGQHYKSPTWMHNKGQQDIIEMMDKEEEPFCTTWRAHYGERALQGLYIRRKKVMRKLGIYEIKFLPPKHEARENPDMEFERTITEKFFMNLTNATNKVEVVFNGEEPRYAEAKDPMDAERDDSCLHRNT